MKPIRKLFVAIIILALGMLACNLPFTTPKRPSKNTEKSTSTPTPDKRHPGIILTLVAQKTNQAATQQAQSNAPAPTTAPAATPSTPIVTVSSATNCRTGPGTEYDLVLTFQPGATAVVVGKYTLSNYWIINTPTGGTCWLWGAYATVQGNVDALAEIVPPAPPQVAAAPTAVPNSGSNPSPTPTPKSLAVNPNITSPHIIDPNIINILTIPAAPSLTISTICNRNVITGQLIARIDMLNWPAVSNATGYCIYQNGVQLICAPGHSYQSANLTLNTTTYGVAAYNSNGTSGTTSASSHCP